MAIPVIDLFAGPGGLGEGFSAFVPPGRTGSPGGIDRSDGAAAGASPAAFHIALSVEKDPHARETLRLRSFYRQFPPGEAPELYYALLRGEVSLAEFPERLRAGNAEWFAAWEHADREAIQAELGAPGEHERLSGLIRAAIAPPRPVRATSHRLPSPQEPPAAGRWVLIGGPPCQAYSVVGRSRNKGKAGYRIEDDHRSSLYREYLRIIADHWPAVFVMENVKGMLSAKVDGKPVFERILNDLRQPLKAMGQADDGQPQHRYRIVPVVPEPAKLLPDELQPRDFIVECEKYGIPQTRHRVILIGIRADLGDVDLPRLQPAPAPTVRQVIGGMPRLRSGVSRTATTEGFAKVRDTREEGTATICRQVRPDPGRTRVADRT